MADRIFIAGIGILFLASFCISQVSSIRQRRSLQVFVDGHNRKVMLGISADEWNLTTKDECIHDSVFFKLENSGTYDASFVKDCEYRSYIDEEDMFAEE